MNYKQKLLSLVFLFLLARFHIARLALTLVPPECCDYGHVLPALLTLVILCTIDRHWGFAC